MIFNISLWSKAKLKRSGIGCRQCTYGRNRKNCQRGERLNLGVAVIGSI